MLCAITASVQLCRSCGESNWSVHDDMAAAAAIMAMDTKSKCRARARMILLLRFGLSFFPFLFCLVRSTRGTSTHTRYVASIRHRISLLHLLFPFYFRLYEFILCAHMSCTVSNCRRAKNNTRISCMQIWTSISTSANDKMWSVLRESWPTIIIRFADIDSASVSGSVDKWIILYTDARRLIVPFH